MLRFFEHRRRLARRISGVLLPCIGIIWLEFGGKGLHEYFRIRFCGRPALTALAFQLNAALQGPSHLPMPPRPNTRRLRPPAPRAASTTTPPRNSRTSPSRSSSPPP